MVAGITWSISPSPITGCTPSFALTMQDGSTVPLIFGFSGNTAGTWTLSCATGSETDTGNYPMTVTMTMQGLPYTCNFNAVVGDWCITASISINSINTLSYSADIVSQINFSAASSSNSSCGAFYYSVELVSGETLPSFIKLY